MKCIMIIENSLPIGLIANTAASMGISLSAAITDLTGRDIIDKSGRRHSGITNIPVPILTAEQTTIKDLYDKLLEDSDPDLYVIGFSNIAQASLHYDDYEEKMSNISASDLEMLGICLYGLKKKVNKLTGNLSMLR